MKENDSMPSDLPEEQLAAVLPVVEELSRNLKELIATLPPDAESALVFHPETGDAA